MGAPRLRLAAEEDDLVAESLQRLADGEGERLDAADLRRARLVECRVGNEEADLHAAPAVRTRAASINAHASASTRSNGSVAMASPKRAVDNAR